MTTPASRLITLYGKAIPANLRAWFAGGIAGKKVVLVGNSTTDFAYGLNRALWNYYTRNGRELAGVAVLNYGINGQTLAAWLSDASRYGKAGAIAENAEMYVLDYGINDVRQGATSEDALVTLLESAVDALVAGVPTTTVLLRMPNSLTTSDTGSYGFITPQTPAAAQSYSTILRNAYLRVAISRNCPVLDTQALVFGVTSLADTLSPYMLNQLHPNDAGNQAVAKALVKKIGVRATARDLTYTMAGSVVVGTLGSQFISANAKFAFGFADYVPSAAGGSLTIEVRKYPVGGGASVQIGTITYAGGTDAAKVMVPAPAVVDWTTLVPGDAVEVNVTACTVTTSNLTVHLALDEAQANPVYPLLLRGNGLVSSADGSVVYAASQALPASRHERTIGPLKALKFWRLGTNRFTKYSNDVTKTAVWTKSNITITGSPGGQVLTASATNCIAAINTTVTAGEQLTFSWKATATGTPKYAIYDATNAAFIVASTNWPAADGAGWRNITFTVPALCTQLRCYPLSAAATIGDAVTLDDTQLSVGAARTQEATTNSIGSCMVVDTGAVPAEFTRIQLLKVDGFVAASTAIVGPGGALSNGNPAFQAVNNPSLTIFGYPVVGTRSTAPRGANGAWQVAVLRYTGSKTYVTLNDQGQSVSYAGAADATALYYNLYLPTDTTGPYQNWDGELISEFYPYLLSEGAAMARVRDLLRTLQANGETITADWAAQKLF